MSKTNAYRAACVLVFLSAAILSGAPGAGGDWKPVSGPLMTKWARDVSPEKVWPDYPRPQMVRQEWVNLNGLWDYAIVPMARIADASGRHSDGSAVGTPAWQAAAGP